MKTANMTSTEIRDSFLAFFRGRGHEIVPSSPVVLPSDPTLLFANAGMNQFKDIFLGARDPTARRVADSQKCIRVSGKHNDLEEVGFDTYHHTFFEMLGNWSFGDYYKREAIGWAWELLTGVWKLPKARLWVTVFRDDDEAARLWRETTDIDPAHILRFDEKDNFWEMGETGPCGPCSEIHYDGTEAGAAPDMINAGRPDVIEIWNLVFIQYNRRSDGTLEDLPAKHVDTGMGFERIVRVLQGKASNYDTDVFEPLIRRIAQLCGRPYEGDDAVAMRVIADHVRTLSFAIADGVLPSNEGRGYVLRRLLRRAVRFGRRLGFTQPFLGEAFAVLEHTMGGAYPELGRGRDRILRALRAEEAGFAETLDRGLALFDAVVARVRGAGGDVFPGDEAFRLYDTYGFPVDLTRLMAREAGLSVDENGFERLMEEQRDRARQARRGAGPQREADVVADLVARGIKSRFVGYATPETETRLLAVFAGHASAAELAEGQSGAIVLAETPFYAESGGQTADKGVLTGPGGQFEVTDVQRPAEGIVLHAGRVTRGRLRDGETVHAMIDGARRARVAAHHTATHLLNAALREFVHAGVKQAGSLVTPDRLRFDFTWFEAVPRDVLARVEERVNEWIAQNAPVQTYDMALRDVAATDIVAVFDEKYGDVVRVVEVPGVSRELCGGTHASSTGQIALFRIASESSVAAGVRRIEAVCGLPAYLWTRREHDLVRSLCETFSSTPEELPGRVEALLEQNRSMEKERRQQAAKAAVGRVDEIAGRRVDVRGVPVVAACVGEMDMDPLRQLLDALRQKHPEGALVLGSTSAGKACFVAAVSDDLVRRGVHAGRLVGQVAKAAGGGGGGQPGRAQAGAKDGSKAEEAVAQAPRIVDSMLGA
jgi:alanyl-tRNA synthetase